VVGIVNCKELILFKLEFCSFSFCAVCVCGVDWAAGFVNFRD
jgi:hypothetical protein